MLRELIDGEVFKFIKQTNNDLSLVLYEDGSGQWTEAGKAALKRLSMDGSDEDNEVETQQAS